MIPLELTMTHENQLDHCINSAHCSSINIKRGFGYEQKEIDSEGMMQIL